MSDVSFPEDETGSSNPESDSSADVENDNRIVELLEKIHQRALKGRQLKELLGNQRKFNGKDFEKGLWRALFGEPGSRQQKPSVARSEKLLTSEEQNDINDTIEATRNLIFQKGKSYTESRWIADMMQQDQEEGSDSEDIKDMYKETKFVERGIFNSEDAYVSAHASPGGFIDDVVTELTIDSLQPESKADLTTKIRGDGTFDVEVGFPDHTGYMVQQQALEKMTDEEAEIIRYQCHQVREVVNGPQTQIPPAFQH